MSPKKGGGNKVGTLFLGEWNGPVKRERVSTANGYVYHLIVNGIVVMGMVLTNKGRNT